VKPRDVTGRTPFDFFSFAISENGTASWSGGAELFQTDYERHRLLPVCTSSLHLAQFQTMKRFGTIFPFVEQGATNLRVGRLVANHDFAKALLKYSSFDEFVFSNPASTNLKAFEELVRRWDLPASRLQKIRCVSYVSLSETLQKDDFHVFHLGGWGYFMPGLHYLRNRYARNPWPITAVTHSLNGRRVIDFAVRLATIRPGDSNGSGDTFSTL